MVQTDYRGARGANAGDDFQELWALRRALALLDQEAGLTAVAVEGLKAEDENVTPRDTWDGVDCSLYYGGNQAASAALQEMKVRLPSGSVVIVFDCYGSGRYLDSDAFGTRRPPLSFRRHGHSSILIHESAQSFGGRQR